MDTATLLNVIAMLDARITELRSKLKYNISIDDFMGRICLDPEDPGYIYMDRSTAESEWQNHIVIAELENFRDHLQSGVEAQISAMETTQGM